MKKLLLLPLITLLFSSFKTQTDAEALINALKNVEASQVTSYFDKIIDIKFPEKEGIKDMGKNQAGIAFRSFFTDNNIKGFELGSQRELDGLMYITGKLLNDVKGYNLTLILKSKADKYFITRVQIN